MVTTGDDTYHGEYVQGIDCQSVCCTPETTNTCKVNSISILKKKKASKPYWQEMTFDLVCEG